MNRRFALLIVLSMVLGVGVGWACNQFLSADQAKQAGVFGVPAWEVDGKVFWGQDALPMLRSCCRNGSGSACSSHLSGSLLAQNAMTAAGTTALSASASRRLRISPTAGMAKERRRAAELPPESKGVTR